MIGNDIVDLNKSALNWQRPGFQEKVFSKDELNLISISKNPKFTVSLLWGMKEAAYKVYVQQYKKRSFNPSKLNCVLFESNNGLVKIENQTYQISSTITKDYIYSVASTKTLNVYKSEIFKLEDESYLAQSESIRHLFFESFSIDYGFNLKHLYLKKSSLGIPELFYRTTKLPLQISLTHCGNYAGYVYSR